MPVLVVLPGIAAYVLHQNGELQQEMLSNGSLNQDNAYSSVVGFFTCWAERLIHGGFNGSHCSLLSGQGE